MVRVIFTFMLSCLVLLLAFTTPAEAEFKRNYALAKKSYEDGDYSQAVRQFQDAIKDNPESAERVKLYGMRYDSYIPYYFLGEAYFKLNDCSAAMTAWNQAIKEGVVQSQAEFSSMQANMANCKVEVIDVSSIAAQAKTEIDGLDSAVNSFASLESSTQLKSEWSSKWKPEVTQGKQLAQTLRQRLAIATQDSDADAIELIINEAKRGVSAMNGSERLAKEQIKAIKAQGAEAQRLALEDAREALRSNILLAKAAEKYQDGNSQMKSLLADLEQQVTIGEGLGATASATNIKEQTQIISNVLRRYNLSIQDWQAQKQSIADRTPPPDLKRLAEAYFAGDYESVAKSADPESFNKNRAKIQALLFRAAANYKLYVRTGEQESGTLRQIENDIRAIKKLDRKFTPYIAAFSPRFLEFFKQTT
jgi:hypothetical protein